MREHFLPGEGAVFQDGRHSLRDVFHPVEDGFDVVNGVLGQGFGPFAGILLDGVP